MALLVLREKGKSKVIPGLIQLNTMHEDAWESGGIAPPFLFSPGHVLKVWLKYCLSEVPVSSTIQTSLERIYTKLASWSTILLEKPTVAQL
jgi:uncharacterized Fe-S cluster-containing MiaB family protein